MKCFNCGHYIQHKCEITKVKLDSSLGKKDLQSLQELIDSALRKAIECKENRKTIYFLEIFLEWANKDYLKKKSLDSLVCYLFGALFNTLGEELIKSQKRPLDLRDFRIFVGGDNK